MSKLDKAIKEEQEKFDKKYNNFVFGQATHASVKNFLKESNKRIAKAALEASRLEERQKILKEVDNELRPLGFHIEDKLTK